MGDYQALVSDLPNIYDPYPPAPQLLRPITFKLNRQASTIPGRGRRLDYLGNLCAACHLRLDPQVREVNLTPIRSPAMTPNLSNPPAPTPALATHERGFHACDRHAAKGRTRADAPSCPYSNTRLPPLHPPSSITTYFDAVDSTQQPSPNAISAVLASSDISPSATKPDNGVQILDMILNRSLASTVFPTYKRLLRSTFPLDPQKPPTLKQPTTLEGLLNT